MRVLVTGAAGFIGSNLCDRLLDSGHEVIALDNFDEYYSEHIKLSNISKALKHKNYHFFRTDILDKDKLNDIFRELKPQKVIHLAAMAGVRASFENPEKFYNVNVEGTKNILEFTKNCYAKQFIFSSSSSVYGDRDEDYFKEDFQNLIQKSPYAKTKFLCESLVEEFSNDSGILAICLRLFTVYGRRQRPDLAICKFIKLMEENKPLPVFGDGSMMRDYTHISDVLQGISCAMEYENTRYEIINLGSNHPISLWDMIKTLETVTGKKPQIQYDEASLGDVKKTCASLDKAKLLLGYIPKVSFEDGLRDFYQSR